MLKIINFYLFNFWKNTKFNNTFLSFLRIFFERNNKIEYSLNLIGNIYKNSKWTDLQSQNIKNFFLKRWFLNFFYYIEYVSFFFFFFYQYMQEFIIFNIFYVCGSYFFFCKNFYYINFLKTHNLIFFKYNNFNKKYNKFFLQKTLLYFKLLKIIKINPCSKPCLIENYYNKIHFKQSLYINFLSNVSFLGEYYELFFLNERKYMLKKKHDTNFFSPISIREFFFFKNIQNDFMFFENIFLNKNNIAKQQRWLTHNFWNTNSNILDFNKNNLNKFFLQNSFWNFKLINSNVWTSAKFFNKEIEQLNFFSQYNENIYLNLFFRFNESQFFFNQRYFFNNNLNNNLVKNTFFLKNNHFINSNLIRLNIPRIKFYNNFFQNKLIYYPLFFKNSFSYLYYSNNTKNYYTLQSFYSFNFYDFLQKNELMFIINLNTTTSQTNKWFFNKNFSLNNFFKN